MCILRLVSISDFQISLRRLLEWKDVKSKEKVRLPIDLKT